jgi:hypothetical protein
MNDLTMAVAVVQGLGALVLALFGWYGQRSVARLDDYGNRINKLESADEVFEIRLAAAATGDSIRSIIREELDRAMAPIVRDAEDIRARVVVLEKADRKSGTMAGPFG